MRPALVVAGARPNFMKVAPLLTALEGVGAPARLVHTGQHYDAQMSDAFFRDLGLPEPAFHLGVGSGSHAAQTARIMERFEPLVLEQRPAWVVVVGDVNSTLACALATSKVAAETGTRIAHVEAGLRSGDWGMPEEVNRVLTDRLSDLLLTPSEDAAPNLVREGIDPSRIVFVGNLMIDTLHRQLTAARLLDLPRRLGLDRGQYVVATLHRPSNVGTAEALRPILGGLALLATDRPVVVPVHPRTRRSLVEFGLEASAGTLRLVDPLSYRDMLSLVDGALGVVTDSGGLQEEATALSIPCVTLREQTERPVTVTHGTNRLAPWPLTGAGIVSAFEAALTAPRPAVQPAGWDGHAATRVAMALMQQWPV